jgi:ParB family chromosome partitioning protein
LPITSLKESPLNPRQHYDVGALADLTASIKANGVLNPLLVRPVDGHHEIIAGHRRRRAAEAAGLTEVPVTVRTLDDTQALELMVIDNLQRQDVHPLEEANGYRALMDRAHYEVEAIAAKVGKSVTYVYQRLKLIDLGPAARKAFLSNELTAAHAILLARLQPADQKAALEQCFLHNYGDPTKEGQRHARSVRDLAAWINDHLQLDLHAAPFKKDDDTLVPAAGACRTCPKRTGNAPALFPDVAKGDTCTDPNCYHAKLQAHLDRTLATLEADGSTAARISERYYLSPQDKKKLGGVLVREQYRDAAKKKCPHTVQAVVVDSDRGPIGSVKTICTAGKACEVHAEKWERQNAASSQRRNTGEKAKARAAELETKIRRAILTAIVAATGKLKDLDFREVAIAMAKRVTHDDWKAVWAALGWVLPKKTLGSLDYRGVALKRLAEAPEREIAQLLVAATLGPDATVAYYAYAGADGGSRKALLAAAARLKVDVKAIERPLRAAAEEKASKKLAAAKPGKTVTRAKTGGKAAKPKPGTCRVCGCTEHDPCPEGCGWADAGRTLCTSCVENEKPAPVRKSAGKKPAKTASGKKGKGRRRA